MRTIIEYLINNHVSNKDTNKNVISYFIDIPAKDVNNLEYKDYVRFRNGSWRVIKYIKKEDLFNADIHETIDALNELFKDTIGDVFVEIMEEKAISFQKALTISLNGYVVNKRYYSEEATKIYDYFNSFKK